MGAKSEPDSNILDMQNIAGTIGKCPVLFSYPHMKICYQVPTPGNFMCDFVINLRYRNWIFWYLNPKVSPQKKKRNNDKEDGGPMKMELR